jgi:hypothetical protein
MKRSTQFMLLVILLSFVVRSLACETVNRPAVGGSSGESGSPNPGGASGRGGGSGGDSGGGSAGYSCPQNWVCDGNAAVLQTSSDPPTCSIPTVTSHRIECGADEVCFSGDCVPPTRAPTKTCAGVTDCALPATLCVVSGAQMVFSDPTCDEGQCHWKQTIYECIGEGFLLPCVNGQCVDGGMLTRGPVTPMPLEEATQPAQPPGQACMAAPDCSQPAPGCFGYSLLTYVSPSCQAGACVWELNLTPCDKGCSGGKCLSAP